MGAEVKVSARMAARRPSSVPSWANLEAVTAPLHMEEEEVAKVAKAVRRDKALTPKPKECSTSGSRRSARGTLRQQTASEQFCVLRALILIPSGDSNVSFLRGVL